jgi:hypothetical protein
MSQHSIDFADIRFIAGLVLKVTRSRCFQGIVRSNNSLGKDIMLAICEKMETVLHP